MKDRYTWSAHGAPYPLLYIIDWGHPKGPKVIGAVPQNDEPPFAQPAAEAVIRLMEVKR